METNDSIQLAHGGGGRLAAEFVHNEIVSRFGTGPLQGLPDAANLLAPSKKLIFTTDSFVVQPNFFPGGNIGCLSVYGTVNDIAVSGGRPLWISLGLILEEGLPLNKLRQVLDSIKSAAAQCEVTIATGDTKVVGRGQCDGLYINTAGIGAAIPGFKLGRNRIKSGDIVLVSGTLAEHGMAVLAARKEIGFAHGPQSDNAPVHNLVAALTPIAKSINFMRDPTRGGLASILNEIAAGSRFGITLDEAALPFSPGVTAAAEMLGLDPLHVASEGRIVLICKKDVANEVIRLWQSLPEGKQATIIGQVTKESGRVVLQTAIGGRRLIDMPQGELLPRIC